MKDEPLRKFIKDSVYGKLQLVRHNTKTIDNGKGKKDIEGEIILDDCKKWIYKLEFIVDFKRWGGSFLDKISQKERGKNTEFEPVKISTVIDRIEGRENEQIK